MAHEVAMVFDKDGQALYWLDGAGASVEDSRSLWDVLWEHRENLGGVAHTHPWDGPTGPSGTDLTTFAAIEAGLGKRLLWTIVTMTHEQHFVFDSDRGGYREVDSRFEGKGGWQNNMDDLRRRSQGG